jgi:DNA-binding NarL/FixJ family response regulator
MGKDDAPVEVAAGWSALRAARWADAARVFEAVLAAEESAEAWEGLSWAAWWLDDAETVFSAREHAYRRYREQGDGRSAARMATWLASDSLDFRGAVAVASGWLQRAHRLLDTLEPGPDHGWLAFHDGYIARLRNESGTALELAARAAEMGRRFGVPDLEMLGLALEGATLVDRAEVERGLRCLDEAATVALEGEATIPISGAWTCCFVVGACASVRDFERAAEWCGRIADFADRYGSRYMLGFCRAEYGAVHLWRGEWQEAERLLEASIADFSSSRPAWSGPPRVALAELRRRQGRRREAEALLDEAGTGEAAQLARARLALGDDRPDEAARLLDRLLRQMDERRLDRVPALELAVEAQLALGDVDRARGLADELASVAALVGTQALRAAADLAHGTVAAARGDHESARARLESAVDGFERQQAPYDAALARLRLAQTLTALGLAEAALVEQRAAQEALGRLGARGGGVAGERDTAAVTPRERDVLGLLAQGLTNRQIAERLVVSEHTVHRHVTSILRKLDAPTRTAAAMRALGAGLIDRADPP